LSITKKERHLSSGLPQHPLDKAHSLWVQHEFVVGNNRNTAPACHELHVMHTPTCPEILGWITERRFLDMKYFGHFINVVEADGKEEKRK